MWQEGSVGAEQTVVRVVLETALGAVVVEVDSGSAPITTVNFLRYVDGSFYDGGGCRGTVTPGNQPNERVRIEVIQGGIDPERAGAAGPPIRLERTTLSGLRHSDGAISMARFAPDSAVADFFICIG